MRTLLAPLAVLFLLAAPSPAVEHEQAPHDPYLVTVTVVTYSRANRIASISMEWVWRHCKCGCGKGYWHGEV